VSDSAHLTREELAALAWARMQDIVLRNDRKAELRDALGLGRGSGRVKTLLGLTDGPLTLGAIAEMIGVDAPYATLIVNDLQARGLVVRAPAADDRRRKLVALTEAGEQAAHTAQAIVDRPPVALLERLSESELAQLAGLLGRLSK
jgi:DNA-binding MarR family transcriptional regulator